MIKELKSHAEQIRQACDLFIVVGTGGSTLGASAVISALFGKQLTNIPVIFVGDELCPNRLGGIIHNIQTKSVFINYVSKNGSTLEPKLTFEYLYEAMKQRYSAEELQKRIICTTTEGEGELYHFARERNLKTYFIPKEIGGRYSVFTPAGLLPIAVAGLDIEKLVEGASNSNRLFEDDKGLTEEYFAKQLYLLTIGNIKKGNGAGLIHDINVWTFFQNRLEPLGAWLCQLFNESAGKDGRGIFTATAIYPRDLHSLGQMVQDGKRNLVETFISFQDLYQDKLGYEAPHWLSASVATNNFSKANRAIYDGTLKAHVEGGVPVLEIKVAKLDEFHLGGLLQLFMNAVVRYCELLGVNPFTQPGVEAYKTEMRRLLKS